MCSRLEQVSPWYRRGLSERKRFHISEEVFSWWNEEDWEGWFSSWQELHEMQQTPASYRWGWRWWLIIDMKRLLLSTSFAMMTYDWRWGLEHVWWHKGLSGPLPRCLITLSMMWTILWCGKGIPVGWVDRRGGLGSMLLGLKICHLWHFGGHGVVGNVKGYCRQVGVA